MIYILLAILIFISLDKKIIISSIYFVIALLVVLILNELYNYAEYIKKDSFNPSSYTLESYNYDTELNPYNHIKFNYGGVKIPYDKKIACTVQKKILEKDIQMKKLNLQDSYLNKMVDLIEGKPVSLNTEDERVFYPIPKEDFIKDKNCPTVCHIITDKTTCDKVQNIPNFNSESEINQWIDDKNICETLDTKLVCNKNNVCQYDNVLLKCVSKTNSRRCISKSKNYPSREIDCRNRCSYFNIPGDDNISKLYCEGATLSDNTQYCRWDNAKKKCTPNCGLSENVNDPDC